MGVCCTLSHQAEVVNEVFFIQLEEILCSQDWCLWATLITLVPFEEKTHEGTGNLYLEGSHGHGPGEKEGPRELLDFQGSPYPSSCLTHVWVRKARAYQKLILVNYVTGSQKAS